MLAALLAAVFVAQPASYRPPVLLAPPPPPPRPFHEETEQLDFSYAWPREVEALAPLRGYLETDRDAKLRSARQQSASSVAGGTPGSGDRYRYSVTWNSESRAGPLHAYSALVGQGRGDARATRFDGLLWSTQTDQAVTFAELLGPNWAARFRDRFCAGLMEQHARSLAASVPRECPDLAPLAPMPMDYDDDGRFDTVDVLFEGWFPADLYRISIPLAAADVAAGGAEYREYLEARTPR